MLKVLGKIFDDSRSGIFLQEILEILHLLGDISRHLKQRKLLYLNVIIEFGFIIYKFMPKEIRISN